MPIDPVSGTLIAQGVLAAGQAITRGGPRRQYKWNKRAAQDTNQMNRDNAMWQLEQDKRLQQEQRVYDSAEAQMERYKKAGLNPHLIYGSGSGSAGGAFSINAPSIAPSRIDAPDASYPDIAGSFIQSGQALAQTGLTQQKTIESEQKTALIEVQKDIAKTNPMLDPKVYKWVTAELAATAHLKEQQSIEMRTKWITMDGETQRAYAAKIQLEIDAMAQRLGLNTADLKIKNKILESKEFENAIKKVQSDWLKDGDISPEHIRQGLMLILSKMMLIKN